MSTLLPMQREEPYLNKTRDDQRCFQLSAPQEMEPPQLGVSQPVGPAEGAADAAWRPIAVPSSGGICTPLTGPTLDAIRRGAEQIPGRTTRWPWSISSAHPARTL
jgi:hypothetical protein